MDQIDQRIRPDRRGVGRLLLCVAVAAMLACGSEPDPGARRAEAWKLKSSADERAARRAYDGAPPIIPHGDLGADCASCHGERGVAVAGLGYSPPSPHGLTPGMTAARCRQCHVPRLTERSFVASELVGLAQEVGADRVRAPRPHALAPPRIPHRVFMRESCLSCHGGPAAREEIRTGHPERVRCQQCHVELHAAVTATFPPASSDAS